MRINFSSFTFEILHLQYLVNSTCSPSFLSFFQRLNQYSFQVLRHISFLIDHSQSFVFHGTHFTNNIKTIQYIVLSTTWSISSPFNIEVLCVPYMVNPMWTPSFVVFFQRWSQQIIQVIWHILSKQKSIY